MRLPMNCAISPLVLKRLQSDTSRFRTICRYLKKKPEKDRYNVISFNPKLIDNEVSDKKAIVNANSDKDGVE